MSETPQDAVTRLVGECAHPGSAGVCEDCVAALVALVDETEAKAEKWALAEAAAVEAGIRNGAEWLTEKQELERRVAKTEAEAGEARHWYAFAERAAKLELSLTKHCELVDRLTAERDEARHWVEEYRALAESTEKGRHD